jgi:uracil-DNA glycosylase family 4
VLAKPQKCSGCPLSETGKGFCPDLLVPNPEYTIYGEAPGTTEIGVGRPFEGKAGFVLKSWLMHAVPALKIAAERKRISYRNILHCLPPLKSGRPYPTGPTRESAEAHCGQYRSPDIDAKVVILCGEVPQRWFFGTELDAEDATDKSLGRELKGVMGRIGRVMEKNGRKYVFAPHPAFVLRQPALVTHGQRALEIAVGQSQEVTPDYQQWDRAMEELLA